MSGTEFNAGARLSHDAPRAPGRPRADEQRVQITLTVRPSDLELMDAVARRQNLSRSSLIYSNMMRIVRQLANEPN